MKIPILLNHRVDGSIPLCMDRVNQKLFSACFWSGLIIIIWKYTDYPENTCHSIYNHAQNDIHKIQFEKYPDGMVFPVHITGRLFRIGLCGKGFIPLRSKGISHYIAKRCWFFHSAKRSTLPKLLCTLCQQSSPACIPGLFIHFHEYLQSV